MKSYLFVFIFVGLAIGNLTSQSLLVDSLKNDILSSPKDTLRLINLKKISKTYLLSNTDSAMVYAKQMQELAYNKKILYYISDSYDLISNIYEQNGDLNNCISSIDSAKYYAQIINDSLGVIYFLTNKGSVYIKMGRYFEAQQSFEEVVKIANKINRPDRSAAALNNIGAVYHFLGDDKVALDYFIQSYKLRLDYQLTAKLAYSLNNIGAVYAKYGNYQEAVNYHKMALTTSDSLGDRFNYLVANINLGMDYDFIGKADESLNYYDIALKEAKKQNDETRQSHVLERMGSVYFKQKKYKLAKNLLQQALAISLASSNKFDEASYRNSLGQIFLKEKQFKKALAEFETALKLSKEIKANKVEIDILKSLTEYFYLTNNSQFGYSFHQLYNSKKDSLYKAEADLKIANLKNSFELNKKLNELKLKDIELSDSKEESGQRLHIIYFVGIAGFIFLLLAIYILVLYKKIKRRNQIIRKSEEKVKQLLEQEKQLGQIKTQLISTVSHEFRTPMAIISSNAQLLRDYNHTMDDEMRTATLKFIISGVNNMTSMMRNFEVLDKNTILEFKPTQINIVELLTNIANELQSLPKYDKRIDIENNLSLDYIIADKGLITHIARNILVNALKFSGNNKVDFKFNNSTQKLEIMVVDKGIGMSQEDVSQIFENFHRGQNVQNIKGTGVGMSVVKRCVDLHRGHIFIDSKIGVGTTIKVTLPFKTILINE